MLKYFLGFCTIIIYLVYIIGFIISIVYGQGFWLLGLGALLGFYISWSIAGGVIFSPLSYLVLSDWELYKKKVSYAFGGSVLGFFIGTAVYLAL